MGEEYPCLEAEDKNEWGRKAINSFVWMIDVVRFVSGVVKSHMKQNFGWKQRGFSL